MSHDRQAARAAHAKSDNVLTTITAGVDNLAQSLTLGDTRVFGANMVNSLRFAYNQTAVDRFNDDYFDPNDLGANVYNYSPTHEMVVDVTGGFNISAVHRDAGIADNNAWQISEDLTLVRGRHQIALGVNVAYWDSLQKVMGAGRRHLDVQRQITGLGMADFLLGRVAIFEHGSLASASDLRPARTRAVYAQDTWRATDRVTVNAGLRWEPFSGQQIPDGAIANFDLDKFRQGVKSTLFVNAPAGFVYPGDAGLSAGRSGFEKQWKNLSPRAGRRLGCARRRPHGGAVVLRTRPTTSRPRNPGSAWPPVRRTATAAGSGSAGPHGRAVCAPGRRSPPDHDEPRYAVPAVRRVWRRHPTSVAAHAAVERQRRTAGWHELGRVGQLPRQPLGSLVGARRTKPR